MKRKARSVSNQSTNQLNRKASYTNGQTSPDYKHKALDWNDEATEPMVDLLTNKLR